MDIYAEITNRIINEMESGIIPWQKPWVASGGCVSYATGKPYSLLNQMLLGRPGEYATFKQIQQAGGYVRKGQKASMVVFWKWIEQEDEETGEKKEIPFLRYYNVFHIDQCEGLKAKHSKPLPQTANADQKAESIKDTTAYGYQLILRRLYAKWEETPINRIETKDIQEFLNDWKHLAEKYLQEMLIVIKAIFESARRDGHIKENPAMDKRIVIPSKKKTVRKALDLDELRDILLSLDKLELMDRRYMMLLLFTGMRRGEVLGLKWEDVDLKKNVFHIERSITFPRGRNDCVVGKPKTESGLRDVPISPELMKCLQPMGVQGYIIGGEEPITLSIHRRMMERIRRTIDLHGASPHIFRHSYATLLNDAGASVKTIQAIIGHSDVQTTINRYVHSRDKKKQEAVRSVNEMLVV